MLKFLPLFFCCSLLAQVGIGTPSPNENAILEVLNSEKGILLPRVALQETDLAYPMTNHVAGMIVYNTAQSGTGKTIVYPGLYYNNGQYWTRLNPNTVKIGELKHSFATADHNGWYLLDGRAKTSLPATAQANATSIGIGSNLLNGADQFLKAKNGAEVLGSTGGNATFVIAQNNLPNVNFTGTTNSSGIHNHNIDSYLGTEDIGLLSTSALTLFYTTAVAKESTNSTSTSTQTSGSHTHTVNFNSGGANAPVNRTPSYIATNIFIYLGY